MIMTSFNELSQQQKTQLGRLQVLQNATLLWRRQVNTTYFTSLLVARRNLRLHTLHSLRHSKVPLDTKMDETFGLNDQHQNLIRSYLKFNKLERQKQLKFIDLSFQDVVTQLNEPTYTKDEVEELFDKLKELVSGEVSSEAISASHMNVLLFTQMLTQAEKWHLNMTLDFSEIQNRELLDKVKLMEDSDGQLRLPARLQPLDENSGAVELLRQEIERLQKENFKLETKLLEIAEQLEGLQREKEGIDQLCEVKEKELSELKEKSNNILAESKDENEDNQKTDSEQLLGEYEKVLSEQLGVELESMRQEFLKVQSQLTLAEQELERKFNQTAAYSNMKSIIAKKNDQVKELRNQLNNLLRNPQTSEAEPDDE